jgi:CO dehydrogenase maturation factor
MHFNVTRANARIAVAGKGGVGKTTVCAALARLLSASGASVYAVDADPDVSLGLALGVPDEVLAGLPPIIEAKEVVAERTGGGPLLVLNPEVDDLLGSYSIVHDGIRLFRMGGVKGGGSACYCSENSFLRALLASVLLSEGELVLLDMGAGIEHLTRGTARGVDLMLVVSEPGRASTGTAATIGRLASDIGVREVRYVGNKVRGGRDRELLARAFGERLLGCIGIHEEVLDAAASGGAASLDGGFGREMRGLLASVLSIVSAETQPL